MMIINRKFVLIFHFTMNYEYSWTFATELSLKHDCQYTSEDLWRMYAIMPSIRLDRCIR